jgi:phenylacetate-coenzyme A ligase PaaK-like adenylate-forming protein
MAPHRAVFDPWGTAACYADALLVTPAPASAWQQRRSERLGEILDHAAHHSRLYRERLAHAGAGTPMQRLARMRPVGKPELMQRFADWVCDPRLKLEELQAFVHQPAQRGRAFADRWLVWESSGTSGEPALFVQDEHALAVADALEAARGPISLSGIGSGFGLERIAFVGALEGHFASVVSFERARELNPFLADSARSFSFLQPLAQLVEQLNGFEPTVLASYPSMAWVLAQEQREGRLRLALKSLWTGGETLTPAVRRTLARQFRAPVRDNYGASECFLIASECSCAKLHLNADWTVLEAVDARGRPVPEGEFGEATLLTNLANRVQPVIRYQLGDRIRFMPGGCACGSSLPVIEVQGRCDDVLTLEDARGRPVHLAPLALTTVLEDGAGVFDFRLRRSGRRELQLDLFGTPAPRGRVRDARAALRDFLGRQGLEATRVHCHCEDCAAVRGRSGKQQRIVGDAPSQRVAA